MGWINYLAAFFMHCPHTHALRSALLSTNLYHIKKFGEFSWNKILETPRLEPGSAENATSVQCWPPPPNHLESLVNKPIAGRTNPKEKTPVVWKNKNNRSCQDLGTKGRIYPYIPGLHFNFCYGLTLTLGLPADGNANTWFFSTRRH